MPARYQVWETLDVQGPQSPDPGSRRHPLCPGHSRARLESGLRTEWNGPVTSFPRECMHLLTWPRVAPASPGLGSVVDRTHCCSGFPLRPHPRRGSGVRGALATVRRGSRDESHGSLLCFPRTASGNWRSRGAGPACPPGPTAPPGRHASRCLRCRSKEDSAGRGVSPPTPGHPDPFSVAGRVTRPGAGVAGGPAGWCSCPAPALPCCPHAQLQERLFRIAALDPHTSFGWETRV